MLAILGIGGASKQHPELQNLTLFSLAMLLPGSELLLPPLKKKHHLFEASPPPSHGHDRDLGVSEPTQGTTWRIAPMTWIRG